MTILWLILKIILWLLGLLLTLFLCILLGLLFLPVAYKIRAEKYETIACYVQLRIFYLISILYDSKTNNSIKVRLFGKTIKVIPLSEEDIQEVNEVDLQGTSEMAESIVKKETSKTEIPKEQISKKQISKEEMSKSGLSKTELSKAEVSRTKAFETEVKEKVVTRQETKQRTKQESKQKPDSSGSKHHKTDWLAYLKELWNSEDRKPFLNYCKILLRDWWRAIRPGVVHFNLIFGLEDPAETGMWLAKLMALYPFYAPYGNIMGDFGKPTLEGDIKLLGKTNLYRFIKPLIVFITHKQVRHYIKILMKIGKED